MNSWMAQAPANIALIKYMGKQDEDVNLPANASLSYTLDHLTTTVSLETIDAIADRWEPLDFSVNAPTFQLSEQAVSRFLKHLAYIKNLFDYDGAFIVRSNNNFPQGAGIASSASSFAALTKCTVQALAELTGKSTLSVQAQAHLSRMGSGSSCRSFYRPWCLWENDKVLEVKLPYPELLHQVVIVDDKVKLVSSSEAHRRVKTSPLFSGRIERAQVRLVKLLEGFEKQAWEQIYQLCFEEFMDMHQLFETATQPFSYITDDCHQLINSISTHWRHKQDGPLVTMDAGSTIHLLYRPDQAKLAQTFKQTVFKNYVVL